MKKILLFTICFILIASPAFARWKLVPFDELQSEGFDYYTSLNPYLDDIAISDDTPFMIWHDSDDPGNHAYGFHLDMNAANAPWQNFTLWRGTYDVATDTFTVGPAVPLMYFDNANDLHFPLSDVFITGNATAADPTLSTHLATKEYVDSTLGGISFNFFLSDTLTGEPPPINTYDLMYPAETEGVASSESMLIDVDPKLIQAYITEAVQPTFTILLPGTYVLYTHANVTAANKKPATIYFEFCTTDLNGNPISTLMRSENSNILTTAATSVILHANLASQIVIGATDRLCLKIYGDVTGALPDPTVVIHMEGDDGCRISIMTTITALDDRYVEVEGDTMTGILDMDDNNINSVEAIGFQDANHSPNAVAELLYDNVVAGLDDGAFTWYDDDEIRRIVDIDASEGDFVAGDDLHVVTYNWNAGNGFWDLQVAAGAGEWTDTGTVLHPNEEATDSVAIGGVDQAAADIWLGVTGGAIFNQQKNDVDFWVNGDTDSYMLYVDAGDDEVGIGTNAPGQRLHISGGDMIVEDNNPWYGGFDSDTSDGWIHHIDTDIASAPFQGYTLRRVNNTATDPHVVDILMHCNLANEVIFPGDVTISGTLTAAGLLSEWTDTGTVLHPNESAGDAVAIGGTTEANCDIWLGADGKTTFNRALNDVNFNIRGSTDWNTFFVDAGLDRIGIGRNTPNAKLQVQPSETAIGGAVRGFSVMNGSLTSDANGCEMRLAEISTTTFYIGAHTGIEIMGLHIFPNVWTKDGGGTIDRATALYIQGPDTIATEHIGIFVGGTATNILESGLVVNDGSYGADATSDFRVETNAHADAFVVDASGDDIEINVPVVSTSTIEGATLTEGGVGVVLVSDLHQFSITIIDPDGVQSTVDAVSVFPIEAEKFPYGITFVDLGIKTDASSSYTVVFEEWDAPDNHVNDLESVATSASLEAEDDGTIGNGSGGNPGDCDAGSILKVDLPTDDIDELIIWGTFTINQS